MHNFITERTPAAPWWCRNAGMVRARLFSLGGVSGKPLGAWTASFRDIEEQPARDGSVPHRVRMQAEPFLSSDGPKVVEQSFRRCELLVDELAHVGTGDIPRERNIVFQDDVPGTVGVDETLAPEQCPLATPRIITCMVMLTLERVAALDIERRRRGGAAACVPAATHRSFAPQLKRVAARLVRRALRNLRPRAPVAKCRPHDQWFAMRLAPRRVIITVVEVRGRGKIDARVAAEDVEHRLQHCRV